MSVDDRPAAAVSRRAYLLLTATAAGWAGNAVAGRMAVGHVSPMAIVTLRWFVVMAVLAVLLGRAFRAEWPALRPRWRYLFAMGALGYTGFNAIFYWSAHHTSAVNMGVLQGMMPALVLVGSLAAYGTPIRAVQVMGLGATLIGVAIVASRGDWHVFSDFAFNVGDLGIVAATFLYAGYTVALRRRPAAPPLVFFTALSAAAFVSSLPLLAAEAAAGALLWPTPFGWALVGFIALVPSLLSQLMYMRGVELIGPGRAGLFMNVIPLFAAILGVLLLRERFELHHAAGLVFVFGGIWLAERPPAAKPPSAS